MSDYPITGQITDAVTLRDNERKLYALYVTAERQKWRDRIRELVIETVNIATQAGVLPSDKVQRLRVIRAEFKVRINLSDNEDKKIIMHINGIIKHKNYEIKRLESVEYFENEASWLLKKDWERVKHETSPLWLWCVPDPKVNKRHGKKYIKYKRPRAIRFLSFVVSILILVVVLFSITYAIGYAYNKSTKPEKEIPIPLCCNTPSSQPASVVESALPIQFTFTPVIINELSNDDIVTTLKNSVKRSKSKSTKLKTYCPPAEAIKK